MTTFASYYLHSMTDELYNNAVALLDNKKGDKVYDLRGGMGVVAVDCDNTSDVKDMVLFCTMFNVRYEEVNETVDIDDHDVKLCAHCGINPADSSGFCSIKCEHDYGECPTCGAPSRGNRTCPDCREY